ncbi:protein of unknown function [Nitrosomonas communis]|uniref:Integrase DNA-binding domain-containing protein n=2 Tax=Nitrosomonas communis TaxID=44574 RepID=A0A1I4WPM5_9PROT|nr:protein of unknown function [Nitrosomonas communis]
MWSSSRLSPTRLSMTLTKTIIDKAEYIGDSATGERCVIWDGSLAGFGLRVYPAGKKSFILSYRYNGRKRLIIIGQYVLLTLEQARKEAKKYLVDVIQGDDPLLETKKEGACR